MMSDAQVIWDEEDEIDGNTSHVAEHGLTPDEVDEILLDDSIETANSKSSGRPCKFGWTSTGKHIVVIWDEVNEDPKILYPITAYLRSSATPITDRRRQMSRSTKPAISESVRRRANEVRAKLAHKPGAEELVTPEDRADAAPFYFELRSTMAVLKAAREAAGLTLADVSSKTGLALETLSRLETGAATNPTWQTLGTIAVAVGCRLSLTASPSH